jgi:hypothetical protein
MVDAIKSIRINTTHTTPLPKFNINKTTAAEFLEKKEVERYYTACNFHQNQYLYLVKTVLPFEVKLWWDHYKDTVTTWEEFKGLFIAKYDTCLQANERMRILQTRTQRAKEPTDAFIYEMIKMSKIVYPHEPMQQAIERTRNALFHRLRVGLGAQCFTAPEEMLEAIRLVHAGLSAQDKANNSKFELPPITTYNRSDNYNKNKSNQNKKDLNQHKSNGKDQEDSTQSRGRAPFSFRGNGRFGRGGYSSRGNQSSSRGSTNSVVNNTNRQSGIEPSKSNRGGHHGSNTGKQVDKLADVQCLKCRGFGHLIKNCPTKGGIPMAALEEEDQYEVQNEGSHTSSENSDLNSSG